MLMEVDLTETQLGERQIEKRLPWPSIRQLIGSESAMESWSEEGRTAQTADSLSRSGGHLYAIEWPVATIL